jgi:hypothetical protein
MKKLNIIRHITPYFCVFTKPSYQTFSAFVSHFVESLEQTLTGVSLKSGKSISAISSFFNHAKWTAADLKNKMQKILKNRPETRPQESDVICLDGSALAKDGETFEKQTKVFDNADKKVVTGYELCVASVLTLTGIKYVFDFLLYTKKESDSEGKYQIWMRLLKAVFSKTKAWLVILDSGFRNQYLLKFILDSNRDFLIRVLASVHLILENRKSIPLKEIRKGVPGWTYRNQKTTIKIWEQKGIMRAWSKLISRKIRIIVVERSGFRNPMFLCTTDMESEPLTVYQNYLRRWKIEELFLECKESLNLEGFRLRKLKTIEKYITCIFVIHNILSAKLINLKKLPKLFLQIREVLKKYRKIPELLLGGLKKLYEMTAEPPLDLKVIFADS